MAAWTRSNTQGNGQIYQKGRLLAAFQREKCVEKGRNRLGVSAAGLLDEAWVGERTISNTQEEYRFLTNI